MNRILLAALLTAVGLSILTACNVQHQTPAVIAHSAEQEMSPRERLAYGPGFNVDEANLTVTKVVDGDTFEVAGGQRVRVLGIDSCEMNTAGGKDAKESAGFLLANGVALRSVPGGPDKDRFGRLLRYVLVSSGDFGELMVAFDHTGVYAGKNDASPGYVTRLRKLDAGGRNCAGAPVAQSDTRYVPVPGGGDDHHRRGNSRWCPTRWC